MQISMTPLADINSMHHILDTDRRTEADNPLFNELAEVLKKYGAESRFGITLLHKHFDISKDEMLLEYTDEAARIQTIQVQKIDDAKLLDIVETAWCLKDGQAGR
jgi:hypothetical protein